MYRAWTCDFARRIGEHLNDLLKGENYILEYYAMAADATKTKRETVEQIFLDAVGGKGPNRNKVNPIGSGRRYLLELFKF